MSRTSRGYAGPPASPLPGVGAALIETISFPLQAESPHDIWDLARGVNGDIYAPLSPMHVPGSPRLYRLNQGGGTMELLFDLRELTTLSPEAIPASKIHQGRWGL